VREHVPRRQPIRRTILPAEAHRSEAPPIRPEVARHSFMAADFCEIQPDDTMAIWRCGPVGQFAIRNALLLGAGRVIV